MELKQRVINACQELAYIKGFHNITVDELAEKAGISKRTLYRRFKSKDEIVEASVDAFLSDMASEINIITTRESDIKIIIEKMIAYLLTRGRFLFSPWVMQDLNQYYPHLWDKIDKFRLENIKMIFSTASVSSTKPLAINPVVFSTIISSSIQAVLNPEFILENNLTFEEVIKQLVTIFTSAL